MAKKGLGQRVAIWAIAITMAVGSLGAYFIIILDNNNQQQEYAEQQTQLEELQKQLDCKPATLPAGATYQKPEPIKFAKDSIKGDVKTEDVKAGTGKAVSAQDACVTVHYQGNLSDGKVFDVTYGQEPRAFRLDGVITGWQKGFQGMKEGGRRIIYIPAPLAYGEEGNPPNIGPNEPLVFVVDLIHIKE